jgi:hypothetical protein
MILCFRLYVISDTMFLMRLNYDRDGCDASLRL